VTAGHGPTEASARQGESGRYARGMAPYNIRIFGDPVLKQRAAEIANVDGGLVRLAEDMIDTMRAAPGIGLAAPQVGVQKRLFVYQLEGEEEASAIINPVIAEVRGEWEFEEGCLSIPGLYFPIVRPKEVHLRGYDLEGNEVSIEADEVMARAFQHEIDHLDGRLLLDLLDKDQRKAAMKELRQRITGGMAYAVGEQRGL
jgi:peptide deformylase